jgi:hypothetical protein
MMLGLGSSIARSEPDVFGLGNGQHGPLRVQDAGVVLNTATALSAPVAAGDVTLTVRDSSGFSAGELVLVLQVQAEGPPPATGTLPPLDVTATGAGRWELARLEAVTPGLLRLTAPLVAGYAAPGSQVVRVPEHTDVTVPTGASLRAAPWDGGVGGVLALLASGAVLNEGTVSADGAGFRGGAFAVMSSQPFGCVAPDQSFATGGASKGESLFSAAPGAPTHGFGALGNGAGGGNCHDSGGGGGGHMGAGGQGGRSVPSDGSRDVGGRGGAALRYPPLSRLLFGGGGGSASGNSPSGTPGTAGGGILYMRAAEVHGMGRFSANGLAASPSQTDGAGGGGAGGSVTVRSASRLDCGAISASGGKGGDNLDSGLHGPGGGGGGGLVWVQSSHGTCPTSALAGTAGRPSALSDGGTYGAGPVSGNQPEATGAVVVLDAGFAVPSVPGWLSPGEGALDVGPRPLLEGTAEPDTTVHVFLDGAVLGTVSPSPSGTFSLTPTVDLSPGPHDVRAAAERLGVRSVLSAPRSFTVASVAEDAGVAEDGGSPGPDAGVPDTDAGSLDPSDVGPGEPLALTVGCGCGTARVSGSGTLLLGVLGLWLLRSRRRRA